MNQDTKDRIYDRMTVVSNLAKVAQRDLDKGLDGSLLKHLEQIKKMNDEAIKLYNDSFK